MESKPYPSRIAELMAERQMSQAHLARFLAVDNDTVRAWQRGRRLPHKRMAARIARALGVTVEELGLPDRYSRRESSQR